MKKLFLLSSLIISLTFIVVSCGGPDVLPPDPETPSCILDKITTEDGETTDFIYNDDNQLVTLISGPTDPIEVGFVYNDDGQVIGLEFEGNGSEYFVDYTLNADGDVISSIVIDTIDNFILENTYNYTGELLTSIDVIITLGTEPFFFQHVFTYEDNNVSMYQMFTGQASTGDLEIFKTYEYEYDNKFNPLYNLSGSSFFVFDDFAFWTSQNNITSVTATDADGDPIEDESFTMEYVYNEFDYPIQFTNEEGITNVTYYSCE